MDRKTNIPKVNVLQGLSNPQNLLTKQNKYLTPECKGLMNPSANNKISLWDILSQKKFDLRE